MVERLVGEVFENAMHVLRIKRAMEIASGSELARNYEETKRDGKDQLGRQAGG